MGQTHSQTLPNGQTETINLNGFDKSLVSSGILNRTDQFNQLIQAANNAIVCGPDCQKQQKTDLLLKAYQDAKTNVINAPGEVTVAAKNYYTFTEGPSGYDAFFKDELTKQIDKIAKELSDNFSKNMNEAELLKKDYNTSYINSIHSQELYDYYLEENKKSTKEVKITASDVFTTGRKSYYEEQQTDGMHWWYIFFVWIYAIIIISFALCIFFVPSTVSFRKKIFMLIFLIIYPFICTTLALYIIKAINYILSFLPTNVYL